MPNVREEKGDPPSKIDSYMVDIDLTKKFRDNNTGQQYEIGPCLGKGGFAKVYLAKKGKGERVAMKIVPRRRISKPEQEQKIENEIQIQSACSHKNILKILSNWSDPDKICLVLEYCPNRTLSHLLKLSPIRRVPEDACVEIIYQVIEAVSYLHSHGIIHRDIKLGNILLNRRVAKLADFGLAINYHTTEQKQICGTPNFLPPEVLRHKRHEPKSDIWAVGCVLFCILTGKPPFQYTTMAETAKNIIKLNYAMPNYLSSDAQDCIRGFLQSDPSVRLNCFEIKQSNLFVKNYPFKDDSSSFMASVMKLNSNSVLPQLKPKILKDQSINRE